MLEYAQLMIEELGFDGFRFDFVKGYGAWIVRAIARYRYVKDGKEFSPFVVGEYWEGGESIEQWLAKVNSFSDNQVAAFDFPLRYQLKDVCDTFHYDLRKLTRDGAIVTDHPKKAVTFVDNHDMGANMIVNDKMLAYSYILAHEGYPSVFWYDYYNNGLARAGKPNGIDALIVAHHRHAGGGSQILHVDPDLYIMQRSGLRDDNVQQSGERNHMELGMIGLGRMGTNMVRRLLRAGHRASFTTSIRKPCRGTRKEGAVGATSLEDFAKKLKSPAPSG
jgi:alpha-amylase